MISHVFVSKWLIRIIKCPNYEKDSDGDEPWTNLPDSICKNIDFIVVKCSLSEKERRTGRTLFDQIFRIGDCFHSRKINQDDSGEFLDGNVFFSRVWLERVLKR